MHSRDPLILRACRAAGIGLDGVLAVVAHASRRRDHGDPVELSLRRLLRGLDGLHRDAEDASRQLDPSAANGHHRDDIPLQVAELGHEISRTSNTILQCDDVLGSKIVRYHLSSNRVKTHTRAAADAQAATALVMLSQQDASCRPERADQMLL
jgi:hypothetical protein